MLRQIRSSVARNSTGSDLSFLAIVHTGPAEDSSLRHIMWRPLAHLPPRVGTVFRPRTSKRCLQLLDTSSETFLGRRITIARAVNSHQSASGEGTSFPNRGSSGSQQPILLRKAD